MAKVRTNQQLPSSSAAEVEQTAPRSKSAQSILDKDGRYLQPSERKKPGRPPVPKPPQPAKIPRNQSKLTTRIIKKTKAKNGDKDASQHAASDKDLEKMRKRKKIMALRRQGATITQISDQMIASGETDCGRTSVYNHLVAGYEEAFKDYTVDYRTDAMIRLDQMYAVELAHFRRLTDPSLPPREVENLTKAMNTVWKRMDDLLKVIHGKDTQSIKMEIPTDTPVTVDTQIRVIMPAMAMDAPDPEHIISTGENSSEE